jgi:hypothetical protein
MRVSDPERARVQWEEILHGTCASPRATPLVYRWPGSPMVLTVDVDPSGSEGPVAIEIEADSRLELPATPVPALGTTVRSVQP